MKVHSIVDEYNLFVCQFALCHPFTDSSYPVYVPQKPSTDNKKKWAMGWNVPRPFSRTWYTGIYSLVLHLKQTKNGRVEC